MTQNTKKVGQERRRSQRRPILESFSLFIVIPKKGVHRLPVHDASELGLGFDMDTEGEPHDAFPLKQGESLEIHFYLNQSLFLPLAVQVVRITQRGSVRSVGAEFKDRSSKNFKAFEAFLTMLDGMAEAAQVASG